MALWRKRYLKERSAVMVYVLNKDGKPLMPTKRHGKVKHLLRSRQAVIVKRTPFTIQLLYEKEGLCNNE
jgi:hypothetical protein